MSNDHLLGERIAKLPAWAREHIETLERQRDEAVRTLRNFTDEQKPQPFYVEDMVCVSRGAPTTMRRYVHGHWLKFSHRGLELSLLMRDEGVSLQYGQGRSGLKDILFQPTSYQSFNLMYPEKIK